MSFTLPETRTVTVQGRLNKAMLETEQADFLREFTHLYGNLARYLMWDLAEGGSTETELKRKYASRYDIPARLFNSLLSDLKGRLASRKQCLALEAKVHRTTIGQLKRQIAHLSKAKEPDRFKLHQKKRKLAFVKFKLARVAYRRKHVHRFTKLPEDKFAWVGSSDEKTGNQNAQLSHVKADKFVLKLRVPACMRGKYGAYQHFDVALPYGHEHVLGCLERNRALSYNIKADRRGFRVMVACQVLTPEAQFTQDGQNGCIGVDVNIDHLAVSEVDRFGNPVGSFTVPWVTYGINSTQATEASFKAAHAVIEYAVDKGKPIACEALDFQAKRRVMYAGLNRRGNRRLSSFAYNKVLGALESTAVKSGIAVKPVEAAYTSFIGAVKYHRIYQNMSSHCAAAVVIARRALGCKEKAPGEVYSGETLSFRHKGQGVALKFASCVGPRVGANTDVKPDPLNLTFWRDLCSLVSARTRMLRETLRRPLPPARPQAEPSRALPLRCGNVSLTSLAVWGLHDQV